MTPEQGNPHSAVCHLCGRPKYVARGWALVCIGDGDQGCDVVAAVETAE